MIACASASGNSRTGRPPTLAGSTDSSAASTTSGFDGLDGADGADGRTDADAIGRADAAGEGTGFDGAAATASGDGVEGAAEPSIVKPTIPDQQGGKREADDDADRHRQPARAQRAGGHSSSRRYTGKRSSAAAR